MATRVISLPDDLRVFVEAEASKREDRDGDEFVRDLIRREQARQRLRKMILEGKDSPLEGPADEAFFDELRQRIVDRHAD